MGEITYDLDDWHADSRHALDRALLDVGVEHAWDGSTLVVGDDDEAQADVVVDNVEAEWEPPLDPDDDQLVWELTTLDEHQRARLDEILHEARIPHEFDAEGLAGLARDQDEIGGVLDALLAGDDGAGGGGDHVDAVEAGLGPVSSRAGGLLNAAFMPGMLVPLRGIVPPGPVRGGTGVGDDGAPTEPLAEEPDDGSEDGAELEQLFLDVDALHHNVLDAPAYDRLCSFLDGDPPPPWGMSRGWWATVLADARELVDSIAAEAFDVADQQSAALRDRLREYV